MAEVRDLLFELMKSPAALSEMEKGLHAFLGDRHLHGTVQLAVPPEIYTPHSSVFLESEAFDRRAYAIAAGDVDLGELTIWSYRPMEPTQMQEVESFVYPWILGFRHRVLVAVSQGNFFSRRQFSASSIDFYKRWIWYEIERGKRYNVFLTYYQLNLKPDADTHEERVGESLRRILRPFEPSLCWLEAGRIDFLKIGQAAAAAERFIPELSESFRQIGCEPGRIQRWTFPKDFFEYEEILEKISL